MVYELMPNMPELKLRPLIEQFAKMRNRPASVACS